MSAKPRILIAATLGRADLVSQFEGVSRSCDATFVEYRGAEPSAYEDLGPLVHWEDYRSARKMLEGLRPAAIFTLALGLQP